MPGYGGGSGAGPHATAWDCAGGRKVGCYTGESHNVMDCEGSAWNREDSVSTWRRVSERPSSGPLFPASEAARRTCGEHEEIVEAATLEARR